MANNLFGVAQKVRNREFPSLNKPAGLRFVFPFNTQGITDFGYQLQLLPAGLEWVTGCFIDNSQNMQQFQLVMSDTGQRITVPAQNQAVIELLGLASDKVSIQGVTTGNVDVPVTFLNYVPDSANTIWSVIDPGTVIGSVTVNGSVTALSTVGAFVSGSGLTSASPDTPAQIFAANASRRILHVYNPFVNAALPGSGLIAVAFANGINVGDPGAMEISPGGSLTFDGSAIPSQAIYISSPDVSVPFTAFQL